MQSDSATHGPFRVKTVLLAILGALVLASLSGLFLEVVLHRSEAWQSHRLLILTVVALFWVDLLLLWRRPGYLKFSRWGVNATDIVLAVAVGYAAQAVTLFLWPVPKPSPDWIKVACFVVFGPAVEELFARGILLRSFLFVWPPWLSIAAVTILMSLLHDPVTRALLAQCVFCVLYYKRGNSITLSIICHSVTNAVVLFPTVNLLRPGG